MESIKSTAFYNLVIGRNCFCCLCFKIVAESAVHMEDEIFITLNDKKRIEIIVGDLLQEVLGAEVIFYFEFVLILQKLAILLFCYCLVDL